MSLPPFGTSGNEYGATPVPADEAQWLVDGVQPATKAELDALEEENIQVAFDDLTGQVIDEDMQASDILDDLFLKQVHRRMLCNVWRWAGQYRTVELNIGVDWTQVPVETRTLLDDARAWLEYDSYPLTEIVVRLSHGIARVHPFRNGNGRLSRLFPTLLNAALDEDVVLSWGKHLGLPFDQDKATYIHALQQADRGDMEPLLRYATSQP